MDKDLKIKYINIMKEFSDLYFINGEKKIRGVSFNETSVKFNDFDENSYEFIKGGIEMDRTLIKEIKDIVLLHQKNKAKFIGVDEDKIIFKDEEENYYELVMSRCLELIFCYKNGEKFVIRKIKDGKIEVIKTKLVKNRFNIFD